MDSKNIFKDFMSFDEMAAALVAPLLCTQQNQSRQICQS